MAQRRSRAEAQSRRGALEGLSQYYPTQIGDDDNADDATLYTVTCSPRDDNADNADDADEATPWHTTP